MLRKIAHNEFWGTHGLLIARVIMGGVFVMASLIKFQNMDQTAAAISSVHIPYALFLAWAAAIFEIVLGVWIIIGIFFKESALLLAVYALFLAFMFHGPSAWASNQMEFGFFVDHFVMIAGLLYMIGHGAGHTWRIART